MNTDPSINIQYDNFSNILRLNTHRINTSRSTTSSHHTLVSQPYAHQSQPTITPSTVDLVTTINHNESINHNLVSPNIRQRIDNLLESTRNATNSNINHRTPSQRILRPRRQI